MLNDRNIGCCTVNRKGMSQVLKITANQTAYSSLAINWHDRWAVTLLTAIHEDHKLEAEEVEYSQNVALVVKGCIQMRFAESTRKNMKL
jgi:hypothetical protein